MEMQSLFWYDLETFGTHTQHDRIAQFAGVRTNRSFEAVEDPVLLYVKIPADYIPDPLACLVTGITPQQTLKDGVTEYEAVQRIAEEFSRPGTCVVGYNNIRFDDEFIRNCLYRNLMDPYRREYADGNSRWDIIDLMRAAHDLRPEGMNWPVHENGKPSFRLGDLTKANGIEHEHAHDALADVYATIALAKKLYQVQKDLFLYSYKMRKKQRLKNLIALPELKPLVCTSFQFTTSRGCTTLIVPLTADPRNSNNLICFDLQQDPETLITCPPSRLQEEVQLVHVPLNKCPFIAPYPTLDDSSAERLGIDRELCLTHLRRLQARHDIPFKIRAAFEHAEYETVEDPDFQIYSKGFFSDADRERFSMIHRTAPEQMLEVSASLRFDDSRAPEMIWRFVCRNFPDVLTSTQRQRWNRHVASRMLFPPGNVMIDLQFFRRKIREKASSPDTANPDRLILKELSEYVQEMEKNYLSS